MRCCAVLRPCKCSLSFSPPCCAVLCVLCPAGAACCSSAAAASASCRCCCGQPVRWRAWCCSHSSHQIWLQQRSCSCRACLNKPPVHRLTSRHCLMKPSVYRLLPALTINCRPCLIKRPMHRVLQALTISFRASLPLAGRSWCLRSVVRGCGRWGPMPWPCCCTGVEGVDVRHGIRGAGQDQAAQGGGRCERVWEVEHHAWPCCYAGTGAGQCGTDG